MFKYVKCFVAVGASSVTSIAWALDPMNIELTDGLRLTPFVEVEQYYDDNVFADEKQKTSSWVTVVRPTLALSAETKKATYRVTYALQNESYASDEADDHTDQYLDADVGLQFDVRNHLQINAGYDRVQDISNSDYVFDSGPVVPRGNDGEPAKYTTTNFGGVYTYGAPSAIAQIELAADYQEVRYQNSDDFNKDLEYNALPLRATGYYRVAPKTKLLAEMRHTDYDYLRSELDSKNIGVLGGVTWDATSKTSGTVKIGAEEWKYDNSDYKDQQKPTWEAAISWRPQTNSTLTLSTDQGYQVGTDEANIINSQTTGLKWRHQWLERFGTELGYSYTDNQYENSDRVDNTELAGVGLVYDMRRWFQLRLDYKFATNNSNFDNESYDRNIYMMTFGLSL